MSWVLVFTATVIADVVWAEWARAVADKRPIRAGLFSAGIILCGTYATVEIVKDHWLFVPALAGAFLGTWGSVRRGL